MIEYRFRKVEEAKEKIAEIYKNYGYLPEFHKEKKGKEIIYVVIELYEEGN